MKFLHLADLHLGKRLNDVRFWRIRFGFCVRSRKLPGTNRRTRCSSPETSTEGLAPERSHGGVRPVYYPAEEHGTKGVRHQRQS